MKTDISAGQVWFSGRRSVRVLVTGPYAVTVRDSYGLRRTLTNADFTGGFVPIRGEHPATPVMACRALADLEPA